MSELIDQLGVDFARIRILPDNYKVSSKTYLSASSILNTGEFDSTYMYNSHSTDTMSLVFVAHSGRIILIITSAWPRTSILSIRKANCYTRA